MRSQAADSRASWVTSSTLHPNSRLKRLSSSNTPGRALTIQIACRLVGQHQCRLGDQGAGNRDALLLTSGELIRWLVGIATQTDRVQQFLCTSPGAGIRLPVSEHQRHQYVVDCTESLDQVMKLEHESNLSSSERSACSIIHRTGRLSQQVELPGRWLVE